MKYTFIHEIMKKTIEDFIKAELNVDKLTPLQWSGVLKAMQKYADQTDLSKFDISKLIPNNYTIETEAQKYAIDKFGHRDEDTERGFENGADWIVKKIKDIKIKSNENTTLSSIHSMKLHEVIALTPVSKEGVATSYYSIMRVAGGWIYQCWSYEKQDYVREIFVPFSNEFL